MSSLFLISSLGEVEYFIYNSFVTGTPERKLAAKEFLEGQCLALTYPVSVSTNYS